MLKVMHICGWFGVGGVEELLLTTARFNIKEKYELNFVCCRTTDSFIRTQIEKLDCRFFELGISARVYDVRILPRLMKVFKSQKPDIVHFYGKISLLGRIAAKAAGVPVVLCNEVDMNWQNCSLGLKLLSILKKKVVFLFTDKLIACSEAVREYWDPDKTHKSMVVYLPHDATGSWKADFSSNGETFKNGKYPVVGTVSRITFVKGHEYLIRAMPKIISVFPSARLRIVGTGPLLKRMKKFALSLGLEKHIDFPGFVEELSKEFAAMDVFVLPSLTEGFPLSLLEAMSAGIPVVASRAGGIPEIVEHGTTGFLVPARDHAALTNTIISLLTNLENTKNIALCARKRIAQQFSPERYIYKLGKLYQELLDLKS